MFGVRRIAVGHAKLGLLRDPVTRQVVLSLGDTAQADFAVPSPLAFARSACGSRRQSTALVGLALVGDGRPASGGEVTATWQTASGSTRTQHARRDARGLYALCDLAPDQTLNLRLQHGGRALRDVAVRLEFAEVRWLTLRPEPAAPPQTLAPVAGGLR